MIDINDESQVLEISIKLRKAATAYYDARKRAANALYSLDLLLASRMSDFRQTRSNIGHETARIMLLEDGDPETQGYYEEWMKATAEYKGLEKICDALSGQMILVQSLIKNRKNEGA